MATLGSVSVNEVHSEEEEFYYLALNSFPEEQMDVVPSVDEWLGDGEFDKRREKRFPIAWKRDFYEPSFTEKTARILEERRECL